MVFRQTVITAVLVLATAHAAIAQSAAPVSTAQSAATAASASPVATTGIDVSRLPINMARIQREFRAATIREEHQGLNLRYFVDVYAPAPALVFLKKEDNLMYGPVPYGAPTHRDILWMLTPPAHRGSLYALPLFRMTIGGDSKKKGK